eukprot:6223515-Amphidinium_carterae.2
MSTQPLVSPLLLGLGQVDILSGPEAATKEFRSVREFWGRNVQTACARQTQHTLDPTGCPRYFPRCSFVR